MAIIDDAGAVRPASSHDAEEVQAAKRGQVYRVKLIKASVRSLQHHRLFFGGLMRMGFDYWEPAGGLISVGEKSGIEQFARFLDSQNNSSIITEISHQFIDYLTGKRAAKIQATHKSMEQFRKWVIIEAGYYDIVVTPSGLTKVAKSISFSNMEQTEFNDLYKSCFSVIWRLVLSKNFENEAECQAAIDNLCSMG